MFPFEYFIVKPISDVKFPLCTTTIWVVTLLFIVIWKESVDAPYVKLDPNVATTTLFCLNPKIFPPQPYPRTHSDNKSSLSCWSGSGSGTWIRWSWAWSRCGCRRRRVDTVGKINVHHIGFNMQVAVMLFINIAKPMISPLS